MQGKESLIHQLSTLCGIQGEYHDIFGKSHTASIKTKEAILRAMGMNLDSSETVRDEIGLLQWKQWREIVAPVTVASVEAQPLQIAVHVPLGEGSLEQLTISGEMTGEDGKSSGFTVTGKGIRIVEEQWIDSVRYVKVLLSDLQQRDIGYYSLSLSCSCSEENLLKKTVKVIIAPDSCYLPPALREGKVWGLAINLYALRSSENWGIGDFSDLKRVAEEVAAAGGACVGLNPLHAIPNRKPHGISPYTAVSRLYRNFIYLDLEKVPEVRESPSLREELKAPELRKALHLLREEEFIDYEEVASRKEKLLRTAFAFFSGQHLVGDTERGREFRLYREKEGDSLRAFSLFCSLSRGMRELHGLESWLQWPEEYRSAQRQALEDYELKHENDLLFFEYLQWLIDGQLRDAAEACRGLGMEIGLYGDLAIGSVANGSDVWQHQDLFAEEIDVGAPPDDFSLNGQKWGFPPLIPGRLRETAYELFIKTIRKNMEHCGALRMDHALGLFRLFWIPGRGLPKDGAYVECPSEDLLRIIALESVRNKTLVIAEDLGTIGENVREALGRFGMLSYRLLYFERDYPGRSFTPPGKYPDRALCAVTTHDLPTLYGYWEGKDLEVRRQLGFFREEEAWRAAVQEREQDKGLLLKALEVEGLLPEGYASNEAPLPAASPDLCRAVYEYLARTPSRIVLVSLDDIVGMADQQNLPGTTDSYPNWLRKTSVALEKVLSQGIIRALQGIFIRNRRAKRR